MDYSTDPISEDLLDEIARAIRGKKFGSVEIFFENGQVSHITERIIKKYKNIPGAAKKAGFHDKLIMVNKNR